MICFRCLRALISNNLDVMDLYGLSLVRSSWLPQSPLSWFPQEIQMGCWGWWVGEGPYHALGGGGIFYFQLLPSPFS